MTAAKRRWNLRNKDKLNIYNLRASAKSKESGGNDSVAAASDVFTRQRLNELKIILGIKNRTDVVRYCVARVYNEVVR